MSAQKNIRNAILLSAEKLLFYDNLLINQCNSWSLEEEQKERSAEQEAQKEQKKKQCKKLTNK